MSNNQNIDIVIKAIDEASANIKRIENQIANLGNTATNASKQTEKSVGGLSGSFGGLGKSIGIAAAAYATFNGLKGILSLTSQVEQSQIAFTTLLGSTEKMKAMMADIDEFAAKTPFEKVNLTPLVQQLIGM
jgi:phage tail tape-measure protein